MTLRDFISALKKSRLLTRSQYEAVKQDAVANKSLGAQKFAQRLVKQKVLTKWQAKTLLTGDTGLVLGKYQLLDVIGRGGMGVVFKALDPDNQRVVAIKVMAKRYWKNKALVSRFKREIQAATIIKSPHVVRAYDAGYVGTVPYLVMEFVDGEDLESVVLRVKRFSSQAACEVIRQAAIGLNEAFKNGIIHRDIKPSNLIITWTDSGQPMVKIFDMGLVRMTETVTNDGATRPGQVMGTPDYMSPEQGYNTDEVDGRSDIYSLGCSLWRLVAGRVPFRGDNPLQVLVARCSAPPPRLAETVNGVDPTLDEIVFRMMARDPNERPQTPDDVVAALAPFSQLNSPDDLAAANITDAEKTTHKDDAEKPDVSFRQFLQDIEAGAQNDFTGNVVVDTTKASLVDTPRPRRKRHSGAAGLIAGAVCAALLGGIIFLLTRGQIQPKPKPVPEDVASKEPSGDSKPVTEQLAAIMAPEAQRWLPGDKVVFDIRHPEFDNADSAVEYKFESNPPDNCTLNPDTGVFEWQTQSSTAASLYQFKFIAKSRDGSRTDETLIVDVELRELEQFSFPEQRARPGREFKLNLSELIPEKIRSKLADEGGKHKLSVSSPTGADGARLEGATFIWTPAVSEIGPQDFVVALVHRKTNVTRAKGTLRVIVGGRMQPQIARIAPQTIAAEQPFKMRVNIKGNPGLRLANRLKLVDGPEGMQVGLSGYVIEWTPTAEQLGRHSCVIALVSRRNDEELARQQFAVMVRKAPNSSDANATNMADGTAPPGDDDLERLNEEIQERFKREYSAARSVVDRRELSQKLLDAARKADAESEMQFALLDAAGSMAAKARDFLTVAQCLREADASFATNSAQRAAAAFDGVRSKDIDAVAGDILPEFLLPFLADAWKRKDLDSARTLASSLRQVAAARRQDELRKMAEEIPDLMETSLNNSDAAAANDARDKLTTMLSSADFVPLFRDDGRWSFFNYSNGDLPDQGRSLWSQDVDELKLAAKDETMRTGFADRSTVATSFILRGWVSAETNTGDLMFGIPAEGALDGYQLRLASGDFCSLRQTGNADEVIRPQRRITRSPTGWDALELAVTENRIIVRINCVTVQDQSIQKPATGAIGIDANLGAANPATVRLRDIRIRVAQ